MSQVKLINPSDGKEVSFEFSHAQRILDSQLKDNIPKVSCWKMVKDKKTSNDNDHNTGKHKSGSKEEKRSEP